MSLPTVSRFAAGLVAALLLTSLLPATAATPASGTITTAKPTLTFTGGPLVVSNPQAICGSPALCDDFALTVTLPADFDTTRPNDVLRVGMTFTPAVDMILQVLGPDGAVLASSDNGVGQPEIVSFEANAGTVNYTVRAIVFAGAVTSYTTTVSIVAAPEVVVAGNQSQPRFARYLSPPPLGNGAGEPSIGYNPATQRAMFQAGLQTLRVTFPEQLTDELNPEGLPESCDAQWEDKSGTLSTLTTLDPIGFVDQLTGRTIAGQLGPKSQLTEYSDDDGESWSPSVGNFPVLAAVDHQTIGAGPYVTPLPIGIVRNPVTDYPNAWYYCSQDIAYANCSRSDDGGITFNPPVIAYTLLECGGLHGHVRVAGDGTVYLPNKGCGSGQGMAVSQDSGLSWSVRSIPETTPGSNDPAVGLANDGTVYFCYAGADGRPAVTVSKDKGLTWSNYTNLGVLSGVVKAVFPQATAGDGDRAACAFIGTETDGNSEALDFAGIFHAYIYVTYDGGRSWTFSKTTPNDPVQSVGGVCTSGTTCGDNRNLLDFNEMTIDERGRLLFGHADGCVGACVNDPSQISRADKASIIRISGARSLDARFDRTEPYVSGGSCLSGTRTTQSSLLSWKIPVDDGAAAITGYKIYRGTSPGVLSLVGSTGTKPEFDDPTADPAVPTYYYRVVAINSAGDGVNSNQIKLDVGAGAVLENICIPPGKLLLTDPANDIFAGIVPGQSTTAFYDARSLSVSQPFFSNGDFKLLFQLKMTSLSQLPPNATWPINFCSPAYPCTDTNVAASETNKPVTVRMRSTAAGAAVFEVLTPNNNDTTRVTTIAESESGFNANGLISISVKASDLGLTVNGLGAEKLNRFLVRINAGAVTPDNMPDSLAGEGEFTTAAAGFCAPNLPPLASLLASVQSGSAPLRVAFDASGSADNDIGDTIASYRFNFGDGSAVVMQSSPRIEHVYTTDGNYVARVSVQDSRGLGSESDAERVIQVSKAGGTPGNPSTGVIGDAPGASGSATGTGRFGGSFDLFGLLPLLLALRRRLLAQ